MKTMRQKEELYPATKCLWKTSTEAGTAANAEKVSCAKKKALQLHQLKKHQKVDMRTVHIVANQRARCTQPMSTIPITQKHWLANMCGHPSTQKGPNSANTAEIKIVQKRLKRAIELGMELALVVPIDRNVPHQLHEQRTKSCARGTSGQEEQEPRRVEADGQPGLQTSSTRGRQSDVLPLGRERPGAVAQLKAAEDHNKNRAPQRDQPHPDHIKKINPHGSSIQLDSDARLRIAPAGGKRRGGPLQQSPCSATQTKHDGTAERTQDNPALLHEPSSQPNANPANLLPHSSQRPDDAHVLEAAGGVQAPGAPRGLFQMKLDRYAPRAASGRHTESMHDHVSPRASSQDSNTGRCVVGVRAAVPPRHVREEGEEERARNQLSW